MIQLNTLDAEAMHKGGMDARRGEPMDRSGIKEPSQRAFYLAGYNMARGESAFKCMPESEQKLIRPYIN